MVWCSAIGWLASTYYYHYVPHARMSSSCLRVFVQFVLEHSAPNRPVSQQIGLYVMPKYFACIEIPVNITVFCLWWYSRHNITHTMAKTISSHHKPAHPKWWWWCDMLCRWDGRQEGVRNGRPVCARCAPKQIICKHTSCICMLIFGLIYNACLYRQTNLHTAK